MDLMPYVDGLRADLRAAADGGSQELRDGVERLGFALDPAARLALMEAISEAAAEISADLPDGGVSVRLEGRRLAFSVDLAPPAPSSPAAPPAPPQPPTAPTTPAAETDDGSLSRVSLRIPESVKAQAEAAAAEAGQSLNTWLVSVVRRAAQERPHDALDLTSHVTTSDHPAHGRHRMTGWV